MSGDRPMDLLFRRHRTSESELGTPAPLIYVYAGRDNRDDSNPGAREELEDQLETDSGDGSNGGQPESSSTMRKRGAPQGSKLPVERRLVPRPGNGREMASQNPLLQRQNGGRPMSPKLPIRSELTVRPKLPVQRRLVLGPRDGREIEVG